MEKQTKNSNESSFKTPKKVEEKEKSAPLSRTLSELFKRNGEVQEDDDQKVLRRYDSLRAVQRSVSSLSDLGSKVASTMRGSVISSSKSRAAMSAQPKTRNQASTRGRSKTHNRQTSSATSVPVEAVNPAKRMFGVSLEELMERQSKLENTGKFPVPIFFNKLMEHLQFRAIRKEGILRHAGSKEETNSLKSQLNAGHNVNFYEADVHVLVDLLKNFIRELPGDLLDGSKLKNWMELGDIEDQARRAIQIKQLILEFDRYRKAVLTILFSFLIQLCRNNEYTKMDTCNVARCFAPNLLDGAVAGLSNFAQMETVLKLTPVVETMLLKHEFIFRELSQQYVVIKTINFDKVKRDGQAKLKGSLRHVPTPPSQKVENKVEGVDEEDLRSVALVLDKKLEEAVANTSELKRMTSEQEVLMQRFRLEAPSLSRTNSSTAFNVEKEKLESLSTGENVSPNSPARKLSTLKSSTSLITSPTKINSPIMKSVNRPLN